MSQNPDNVTEPGVSAECSPVIRAANLGLSFGGVKALSQVSLDVHEGEVVTIVGPSGAGKSTFLRCLNMLAPPDSGKIVIHGKPVFDDGPLIKGRELRNLRQTLGMVFQNLNLFPHLTAVENVTLALLDSGILKRNDAVARALELLERVGVDHRALARAPDLSGGEKQRVAIARALAMRPIALLFDEPTSSLDPESSAEVLAVMQELADKGVTMVVVTHEMKFAADVSDHILFMEDGRPVEFGSANEMFYHATSERVRGFFANSVSNS